MLRQSPCLTISALVLAAVIGSSVRAQVSATRVASGLVEPLFVTHAPGDFDRIFIVEHGGRIKILQNGSVSGTPFLDITDRVSSTGERGLLGLAFHPDYQSNGYFYVDYTDLSGDTHIARFSRTGDPDLADDASEHTLLTYAQPYANHNGGWMDFGPDGFLYIASGDGGSGNDPLSNAQNIEQFLGKLLRIDVNGDDFPADADRNYAIPGDNPFVGVTGYDEIWAFGLRNPWRCSFDRVTGDLYVGDVGQGAREEIDFLAAGDPGGMNFGWRCMEGTLCTGLTGCTCLSGDLVDPIHEYVHVVSACNSITGGYVYRGCAMPELFGTYFFADYCRDQIWSFRYDGSTVTEFTERTSELIPPDAGALGSISSLGEDAYGELYLANIASGEIFKIVPSDGIVDCNENGVADACDILDGTSADADQNGIPDSCVPAIPAMGQCGAVGLFLLLFISASFLIFRRTRSRAA